MVDQVADEEASLIGSMTGCRRASDTLSWMPDTMLPFIWWEKWSSKKYYNNNKDNNNNNNKLNKSTQDEVLYFS